MVLGLVELVTVELMVSVEVERQLWLLLPVMEWVVSVFMEQLVLVQRLLLVVVEQVEVEVVVLEMDSE